MNINSKIDLINILGVDYNNFYNKHLNKIYSLDSNGRDCEGNVHDINELYEFPYRESARKIIWTEFRRRLTDADKKRFPDYEKMFIRMEDVIEAGLKDFFREVEEDVLNSMLIAWESENNLDIDWNTLTIE